MEADLVVDHQLDRAVNSRTCGERLERDGGMWGAPAARRQLRLAAPAAESEPERRLARELHRRGWRLELNGRVLRYRGDLVHRAWVVVEVDGRQFHSAPEVFVTDRVRQNELVLDGWLVLRYAASTVLADPGAVADEVVAALRRRHGRGWALHRTTS